MRERLKRLIDVKSLVTLSLTAIFGALALSGRLSAEQLNSVYTTVIAFYFGTQHSKNSKEEEKNE